MIHVLHVHVHGFQCTFSSYSLYKNCSNSSSEWVGTSLIGIRLEVSNKTEASYTYTQISTTPTHLIKISQAQETLSMTPSTLGLPSRYVMVTS